MALESEQGEIVCGVDPAHHCRTHLDCPCVAHDQDNERGLADPASHLGRQYVRVRDQEVAVADRESAATKSEAWIVGGVERSDRRNRPLGGGDDVDQARMSPWHGAEQT